MIEEALGAPLRIRILLALEKWGEINVTELAHILGTNYSKLAAHLEALRQYGLVEDKRIGRARLVKLREADVVISLVRALRVADERLKQLGKTETGTY
ncbi:winged helix-turn-helix domain-containing protein [Pyrobaculum aerophilum]|uniref:Transcriptional regulatory protein (Helix-turn-helix), putative n=2 Tax=Pyrobaculum aerophilum TaxID=13773 RepID=Q8ZYK0_PYRAE|nr:MULTISPECIES: winged helix-turn-helix domain-containing protein [Pyrobaculum]AAL62993.1 transcriptional regulatory protein (helix-turn-helix), putative [Pyrobaculum aerophilum str. IM2]MCX8136188.1 winged helix-turn-helix domain-containing protein [Pyrobaculum aerophilum]HII48235.1 winged helix-turn-helix transcriptional regulator [Pyrobaculum aerophilum]